MIRINLLDQGTIKGSRPGKAAPLGASRSSSAGGGGSMLVMLVAIGMLAINGAAFFYAWGNVQASNRRVSAIETKVASVKKEIGLKEQEAAQLQHYREVLANQMDVLRSLDPTDRILWCEKINMLANLIPANVFIAEVKISEDVKMVETEQSKKARETWAKSKSKTKGKEPEVVTRPVISYVVRLTGLALGKDNVEQFNNVLAFHKAMTEHELVGRNGAKVRFMDNFNENIEFESVEATLYEGTPVNKFIFKLTTKPMGEEDKSQAAGSQVAAGDEKSPRTLGERNRAVAELAKN